MIYQTVPMENVKNGIPEPIKLEIFCRHAPNSKSGISRKIHTTSLKGKGSILLFYACLF